MFQIKVAEELKTHISCSITFFRKSCRLWGNVEKYGKARSATDNNIIQSMRFACWITEATETHFWYIILIAFLLQHLLHDRVSVLRYTYIACLVLLMNVGHVVLLCCLVAWCWACDKTHSCCYYYYYYYYYTNRCVWLAPMQWDSRPFAFYSEFHVSFLMCLGVCCFFVLCNYLTISAATECTVQRYLTSCQVKFSPPQFCCNCLECLHSGCTFHALCSEAVWIDLVFFLPNFCCQTFWKNTELSVLEFGTALACSIPSHLFQVCHPNQNNSGIWNFYVILHCTKEVED